MNGRIRRAGFAAVGLAGASVCGMLPAAAHELFMTTTMYNESNTDVRGGVQNVQFKPIAAKKAVTIFPTVGVHPFSTSKIVWYVDFEGSGGPSVKYCSGYIFLEGEHTFFGGYKATKCEAVVTATRPGSTCTAIVSSPPSDMGCMYRFTLK